MFLSRLLIDPHHPQARRDLASAYEMHRTLSRAFAPTGDAAPLRFLWRHEMSAQTQACGNATVLVQSATAGQWAVLDALPGYLHNTPVEQKEFDARHLIRPGQHCRFRLRCNPTVTRNGKRLGLRREHDQREWLERQGRKHGFAVAGVRVSSSERACWAQAGTGRRITVQVVEFDGVLFPTDANHLEHALVAGVGHAKALGLGLLSVAPQHEPAYPR